LALRLQVLLLFNNVDAFFVNVEKNVDQFLGDHHPFANHPTSIWPYQNTPAHRARNMGHPVRTSCVLLSIQLKILMQIVHHFLWIVVGGSKVLAVR